MLAKSSTNPTARSKAANRTHTPGRLKDALLIADQKGLLAGARTQVVRGRMPAALVSRAKARTGVSSDTELLELALANLAVADDYAEWLLSRRGAVPADIDLEF